MQYATLHRQARSAAITTAATAPVPMPHRPSRATFASPLKRNLSVIAPHWTPSRAVATPSTASLFYADSADAEPKAEAAIGTLYLGKKAVVLGAGPGGATAAMFLARHGFTVEVYDKRPEPKDDAVDEGRSYVIILIPRGQAALQQLGVALPTAPQFRTLGSVRRDKKGRVQVVKEEGNLIFSRSTLAQFLIDQAKAKFPGAITFRFGVEAQSIDVDGQQVVFNMRSASGSDGGGGGGSSGNGGGFAPFAAQYDLLVGADGVGSIVRSALAKALPGFTTEVSDSGREYKVYGGLKAVDGIEPPEFAGRTGATLHLWSSGDPFTSMTARRNPNGTYGGTFSLATGAFARLQSPQDYAAFMRKSYKGLPEEWVPKIAAQLTVGSPNSGGKRIKCSQLYGPGVVLLGDAAHAVTPIFGQGANSALESCLVLDAVLKQVKGKLGDVPAAFDAARSKDAHALFEIDRKMFSFFRRSGIFDFSFLQLLSHVVVGTVLSKLVPKLYGPKPAIFSIGSADMRYSQITDAVRRDARGLLTALLLAASAAAAKLAGVF